MVLFSVHLVCTSLPRSVLGKCLFQMLDQRSTMEGEREISMKALKIAQFGAMGNQNQVGGEVSSRYIVLLFCILHGIKEGRKEEIKRPEKNVRQPDIGRPFKWNKLEAQESNQAFL
ncbi:uncharacterized protein LOC121051819 isoform X2 [Rosa chinensis]|uniref:uncharacterized protein LOC121051819 isoform X2 n=1 Tax=Rosa chinensis TaxID=74649 RepID=UPI001AD8C618|nr:uncharacterized protein LOC121051819 isoform X2 [Rosa chinensis]